MIVLRDPAQLSAHYDRSTTAILIASLSMLLQQRFRDMSGEEVYDPDCHGYIVIAEPGDEVKALEEETGCPIFSDWFGDSHYPEDVDFAPSFEYLDDTPLCYEMVFIINDGGFAVLLFVPKLTGIDTQLLSLCREHNQQLPA
jgi:hypothetical protein